MSKDKAEEKAREYAIKKYGDELIFHEPYLETLGDFKAGYTQAITDLSAENAQLREALREVISRYEILERSVMVHPDYVFGDDNDEWHTFIDCGKEPLNEAKQLLTDNAQDNENN